MTKTRTKALALMLGAGIALSGICAAFPAVTVDASALDTNSKVTYPFTTGEEAFKSAPTFTAQDTVHDGTGDPWTFLRVSFDSATVDLTDADYIAVQIRVDESNPGITVGLTDTAGCRYMSSGSDEGDKFYFLTEDGTMKELAEQFDSIWLGEGACGTLFMPMSSMADWAYNPGGKTFDSTIANSFFFTTSLQFNYDWTITVGEVGIYKGEPDTVSMEKVVDLSKGEREKNKYEATGSTVISFPSEKTTPRIPYEGAFRMSDAWNNVMRWQASGGTQTLSVDLDGDSTDISGASHLTVQYFSAKANSVKWEWKSGDTSLSLAAGNTYFTAKGATVADQKNVASASGYVTINNGRYFMGMIVIPTELLQGDGNASAVDTLVLTSTATDLDIVIGEIAAYSAQPGTENNYAGGTFKKLLSLDTDKSSQFKTSAAGNETVGTVTRLTERPVSEAFGDVTVDVKGEGKSAEDFSIWDGGSLGKVEMVKDSYNEDAMRFMATGTNPEGDAYTAITLSATGGFSWGGKQGISFWARNDGDVEVSFNIETDCKTPALKNGEMTVLSDRFNIKQGNRYWMYDINTGKTTIYMTRPTATLPAGFEGWVWIPFTAFSRADWSNNGVTAAQFMDDNSIVTYLAITIHAMTYQNMPFSVNKFGAYTTTPHYSSPFIDAGGKTIPELLGLD